MRRHYILVEGVNLYENIYDTDQLSIIRGTSFLYKEAIDYISELYSTELKSISTGASSGLFQIKTDNAETWCDKIRQRLQATHEKHHYYLLTFVISHCQADNLLAAKAKLVADLRWQQLQSLTLVPDQIDLNTIPCEQSGFQIASSQQKKINSDTEKSVSTSILYRYETGRQKKYDYYFELIDDEQLKNTLSSYPLAENIGELCEDVSQKLNRKMAVFYVDGNRFDTRQREFIQQAATQEEQIKRQSEFDNAIQTQRKQFLATMLTALKPERRWRDIIRLETLLWGGDEMLFVMPAWEGFDFLQQFFDFGWELPDGEPLTHAAGIVFCQANTPIRIIQQLARDLAEQVKAVKDKTGKAIGRQQDGWDYLVLESVDYPSNESLSGYFTERYGGPLAGIRPKLLPPTKAWMTRHKEELKLFLYGDQPSAEVESKIVKPTLSRGQLYQVVQTLQKYPADTKQTGFSSWTQLINTHNMPVGAEPTQLEQAERRLYQVSENQETLGILKESAHHWFGLDIDCPRQRAWFWIHLLELRDYLVPQKQQEPSPGYAEAMV